MNKTSGSENDGKTSIKRQSMGGISVNGRYGINAQRKSRSTYSDEDMAAVKAIYDGNGKNASKAIRTLEQKRPGVKIPRSTFVGLVKKSESAPAGKAVPFVPPLGAPTALSSDSELLLKNWVLEREKGESAVSMEGLLAKASDLLVAEATTVDQLPTKPFHSNYLVRFLERQGLSDRAGELISKERKYSLTPARVEDMQEKLLEMAAKHNITHARQIFNMDEMGKAVGKADKGRYVAERGARTVGYAQGSGEHGEHVTVCVHGWGDGYETYPILIFKGVNTKKKDIEEMAELAPKTSYIKTKSGGSTEESMIEFVDKVICKRPRAPDEWILWLLDQYWYHTTEKLGEHCRSKNICVLGTIPHATHKIQWADTHANAPLSNEIDRLVRQWHENNDGTEMSLGVWAGLVQKSWTKIMTPSLAADGFKDLGLIPPFKFKEITMPKCSGQKISEIAAVGLVARKSALRVRVHDAAAAAAPNELTASWAREPSARLPVQPLESWSRQDIYSAFKKNHVMEQKNRATAVLKSEVDGVSLGSTAEILTAPERLEKMKILAAEKKKKESEKKRKREEREAKQTESCPNQGCAKKFVPGGADRHARLHCQFKNLYVASVGGNTLVGGESEESDEEDSESSEDAQEEEELPTSKFGRARCPPKKFKLLL